MDGAIVDGSLGKARDLLRELLASTMREGKDLSEPSPRPRRQMLVVPPVQAALKAAFYEAFRGAVPSQRGLARELGQIEGEMRRTLHPDKANKAVITSCAAGRLGILLTMTVDEAA